MKKVQVQMSDECHSILKSYAAFFGLTMSEVLYQFTRQEVQQHAVHCKYVSQLIESHDVPIDKRVDKPCWGFSCLVCAHSAKCITGLTNKHFAPAEKIKKYLKEDSWAWDLYES